MKKISALSVAVIAAVSMSSCGLNGPALADKKGPVVEFDYDPPKYKNCTKGTAGCINGKKMTEKEDWDITVRSDRSGEELELEVSRQVFEDCKSKQSPYFDGTKCK